MSLQTSSYLERKLLNWCPVRLPFLLATDRTFCLGSIPLECAWSATAGMKKLLLGPWLTCWILSASEPGG